MLLLSLLLATLASSQPADIEAQATRCGLTDNQLVWTVDASGHKRAQINPNGNWDSAAFSSVTCLLDWASKTGANVGFISEPPPPNPDAAGGNSSATTPRPPVVSIPGQTIYADADHNIFVEFLELPGDTSVFTSRMPAGWTFEVSVDGNRDGAWGLGSGRPADSMTSSPDRKFGQDSRNGVFCSQYVFTSFEGDPTRIYSSSECGGLPSNGLVIMSGFDSAMRAKLTYQIPSVELFENGQTARIQVCVWDTVRWTCKHTLPNLLELKRLPSAAVKAG